MKTPRQIAYEAYSNQAGGVSLYTHVALPRWEDVIPITKECWEASARAVSGARIAELEKALKDLVENAEVMVGWITMFKSQEAHIHQALFEARKILPKQENQE